MSCLLRLSIQATTLALVASRALSQTVLWQDNFDSGSSASAPNAQYWSFDIGGGGWGNGELQEYTMTNAQVSDGTLKIEANRNGNAFTSSRIQTQNKVHVKYGTIEARIKVPNVTGGLWPAFWTLGANFPVVPWPACGEIDIMEVGQGSAGDLINERVVTAAHWLHETNVTASWPGSIDTGMNLYEDFHTYSLEWTSSYLATSFDGFEFWKMDIDSGNCPYCDELHDFQFLVLNMAVGGGFTRGGSSSCGSSSSSSHGGCDPPKAEEIGAMFPAIMEVDYVRIIGNEETELVVAVTAPPTMSPTMTAEYQDTLPPTNTIEKEQVTSAPTSMPTFFPTTNAAYADTMHPTNSIAKAEATETPTEYHDDDDDNYYNDDTWHSKGSSKGGKGKGGKGKSGGVLCEDDSGKGGKGKSGKGGKGKSSKSGKGGKSSKGGKGKTSTREFSDCGSSTSLRTTSLESSAISFWSPWVSVVLLIPTLLGAL